MVEQAAPVSSTVCKVDQKLRSLFRKSTKESHFHSTYTSPSEEEVLHLSNPVSPS